MPYDRLSWPYRRLLSARKYIVSYRLKLLSIKWVFSIFVVRCRVYLRRQCITYISKMWTVCVLNTQWYMQSDNEEERALFHLLLRMLDYEPTQRIRLSDAVEHGFFSPIHRTSPVSQTLRSPSPKTDDNDDASQEQANSLTSWIVSFRFRWTAMLNMQMTVFVKTR